MAKNVIIGQSGGPTAVINSSLAGVYKAACSLGADKVYGMKHGIYRLCRIRCQFCRTQKRYLCPISLRCFCNPFRIRCNDHIINIPAVLCR